jgi:hypothetical protein
MPVAGVQSSSLTFMMTCRPTALPRAGPRLWTTPADPQEDLLRGQGVINFRHSG